MRRETVLGRGVLLAVTAAVCLVLSGAGWCGEFSADFTHYMNEETTEGKVFVKGDKRRQESVNDEEEGIMIHRPDKGVVWTLMMEDRIYMEVPFVADETDAEAMTEEIADIKKLGKEKVNGYECDKTQYIYHDKSIGILTVWFSEQLGVAVKTELNDPSGELQVRMEYRNIKEEKVPDSMFEIPGGYQKMGFGMPGMMR